MGIKVLFITPRFSRSSGGDGLYAHDLANALVLKKIQLSVLYVRDNKFILSSFSEQTSSWNDKEVGAVGDGCFRLNYYSKSARRAMGAAISEVNPDVLHIHGLHQYFTLSVVKVLKSHSIPIMLSVHDYKILCGNAGFFSDRTNANCTKCLDGSVSSMFSERCKKSSFIHSSGAALQMSLWHKLNMLDLVQVFHCGSEYVRNLLSENATVRDRLKTIRLPILREVKPDDDPASRIRNIVYIGRMVPHKGVLVFSEAVKTLGRIQIDLFGDGVEFSKAQDVLGEKDNVTFHGWKEHAEIEQYLTPNSIVVVPYFAPETFCYVVLEAMMRGCCVVASNSGAIPELIDDDFNGVVVEGIQPDKFRIAIDELINNPEKQAYLAHNARSIIDSVDRLDRHAEKMKNAYLEMLKQGNRVGA